EQGSCPAGARCHDLERRHFRSRSRDTRTTRWGKPPSAGASSPESAGGPRTIRRNEGGPLGTLLAKRPSGYDIADRRRALPMNEKILVVDDERLIRWTLTEALRGWGYVSVEAATVAAALTAFEAEQPKVVLLDIN